MFKKIVSCFKFKDIHTQPQIPDFLAEVDLPQALPMDSADTLRLKAAILHMLTISLRAFFDPSLSRDQYNWLDIAQTLAQRVSLGDIVSRDDLSILVDQLQNPASELYLKALDLLM